VTDLKDAGLDCPIVGGAGTVALKAESGVYTELQVGSYLFMDADYACNDPPPPFAQSLFVLTTVTSTPPTGACWVDTGLGALALDSGMPLVWNRPELTYAGASDEHGRLIAADGTQPVRLGERIQLVPAHCDPTVDCCDWYVGRRGNRVEISNGVLRGAREVAVHQREPAAWPETPGKGRQLSWVLRLSVRPPHYAANETADDWPPVVLPTLRPHLRALSMWSMKG